MIDIYKVMSYESTIRYCLELLETILQSGTCETCSKRGVCEFVPKSEDELQRYNCPFFLGKRGWEEEDNGRTSVDSSK